jgi:hypothetical protein
MLAEPMAAAERATDRTSSGRLEKRSAACWIAACALSGPS